MKRFFLFLGAFMLIAALLVACRTPGRAGQAMRPGTYVTTSITVIPDPTRAYNLGGEMRVQTVVSRNRIESVTVLSHTDSPNFVELPAVRIPAEIVAYQSLNIDVIAGATITSMAILSAVIDAVTQARGDVSAFMAPRPRAAPNAPVTLRTDVLVVGSGIAGLSAAIEAVYTGADVLLIEKLGLLGGVTSTSQGWVQGANNAVMRANGIADSAEAYEAFLNAVAWGRADRAMIRHIAHLSENTIDWFINMGVVFRDTPQYSFAGYTPSRAVRTLRGMGYELTIPIVQYAEQQGVRFMKETPAQSLIMQGGRVVGVNAVDRTGGEVTIYADNVILATGGFHFNPELTAQFMPLHAASGTMRPAGLVGMTGDGLLMGMAVGADTVMGYLGINGLAGVPNRGVWVTPSGRRFTDESYFYGHARTSSLLDLGYNYQFTIMDMSHHDAELEAAITAGTAFRANTVAELAGLINMDPAILGATIARYNELTRIGSDLDFASPFGVNSAERLQPIERSPFFAQLSNSFSPFFRSGGGLKIDLYGRVIHTNGNPIPGLFASGEVAGAQFMPAEYGGSGMALTVYPNMARLAGRTAAAER